jgi:hypothetical protein
MKEITNGDTTTQAKLIASDLLNGLNIILIIKTN